MKKAIYLTSAFLFLIIGAVGAVLPVLPTTPFLLLASFFFARGSERFNTWFLSTELYKNNLDSFVKSRSMSLRTKVKILTFSTIMLIIAFCFADIIYARVIIISIMIYKYYYFIFKIETLQEQGTSKKINVADKMNDKREKEKEVIAKMIEIYCRGNRHEKNRICNKCRKLIDYANNRIDGCPFMDTKTFCSSCKIHCYNVDTRQMIKTVMRYSGTRMLLYHPIMAMKHVIDSRLSS